MIFLSRFGYCLDVSLRVVIIGRVFIALLFVQENPNDRPHMSLVSLMLGSKWVVLPRPSSPLFSVERSFMHDQSSTRISGLGFLISDQSSTSASV